MPVMTIDKTPSCVLSEGGGVGVRNCQEQVLSARELCTIWVVDDDEAMRTLLAEALEERGCAVTQLGNGHEVLNLLKTTAPSLIVTDLRMPGGDFRMWKIFESCPRLSD
ncbi:MAG: response regulator [Nitrospirales bacterium]|nr:response regulator [Nitrospirales bacterium]